jgi:hypothetical protein
MQETWGAGESSWQLVMIYRNGSDNNSRLVIFFGIKCQHSGLASILGINLAERIRGLKEKRAVGVQVT